MAFSYRQASTYIVRILKMAYFLVAGSMDMI